MWSWDRALHVSSDIYYLWLWKNHPIPSQNYKETVSRQRSPTHWSLPTGCYGQIWASLRLSAGISQVFHRVVWDSKCLAIIYCFPRPSARSWLTSEAARTQTSAHTECWSPSWRTGLYATIPAPETRDFKLVASDRNNVFSLLYYHLTFTINQNTLPLDSTLQV